ncbi:MAG: CHAD domain-containing protein, partial [Myxococcota bacterium]|nr:CHAD domain-containing protein [Myxococcota bacterium]
MAFLFKRSEELPRGVERLLRTEIDAARELLSGPSERSLDYRVHEARKALKRLRALLALVKGSAPDATLERLRELLRTASHALAELRSSAALAEAFRALVADQPMLLEAPLRQAIDAALTRPLV